MPTKSGSPAYRMVPRLLLDTTLAKGDPPSRFVALFMGSTNRTSALVSILAIGFRLRLRSTGDALHGHLDLGVLRLLSFLGLLGEEEILGLAGFHANQPCFESFVGLDIAARP